LEEHGLGQLDGEQPRRGFRGAEHRRDRGAEVGRQKLLRRDVDGHPDISSSIVALPAVSVIAGLLEHPSSDLGDEAGLFGKLHDVDRSHILAAVMRPAQERLDADDLSVLCRDDGLVLDQ
jgi:hypothetical protein